MQNAIPMKRVPFEPTGAQREAVRWLVIVGASPEQCRLCVTDPRTGRALSLAVFRRVFAHELAATLDAANAAVLANLTRLCNLRATAPSTAIHRTRTRRSR